eukprot:m.99395 g.99395  ORF g.99395 m.99395 type:complete len:392 (-) comp27155_c1_seq1:100-1275(-)
MATFQPAGMTTPKGHGVSACMAYAPEPEESPTLRRFKAYTNPAPGSKTKYFNDPTIDSNTTFGKKSILTPASALINPAPKSKFQTATEALSMTSKMKQTLTRAPAVPDELTVTVDTGPTFGDRKRGTKRHFANAYTNDVLTQDVLKPEVDESFDEEACRLQHYVKSHGAYLPGERVSRSYNQTFDENNMMGKPTKADKAGAMTKTLQWNSGNTNATHFISDRQKAMQERKEPRSRAAPAPDCVPDDFTFGRPNEVRLETVAALLETKHGDDGDDDDDDVDMRTASRPDAYLMTRSAGTNTIRRDIPVPTLVKVTDTKNYGDQNVSAVLTPSKLTSHGASVSQVAAKRSKEEIQYIFESAGLSETVNFDQVWANVTKDGQQTVSIEEFQNAL